MRLCCCQQTECTVTVETSVRVDPRNHVVLFYDNTEQLVTSVAQFVADGVLAGETALVVATAAHLEAFNDAMVASGLDVTGLGDEHRLMMIDAGAAMSRLLVGDWPARDRFESEIGAMIRRLSESGRPVRIYGEMVALLWDAGHAAAAIELEALWNDLSQHVPFSLLCAYPAASVAGDAESFELLCHCHSAIRGAEQLEATRAFAGESSALSGARQFVTETLRSWSLDQIVDDASVIVSELATNAILHAQSDFVVGLVWDGDTVRMSVRDASPLLPVIRAPSPTTISGRGLILIKALSANWGTESVDGGKEVWVRLRP
jgi:anti-sigma regulatory factor (Ser/Thr protein kinase)